jgi:hypothetical protein
MVTESEPDKWKQSKHCKTWSWKTFQELNDGVYERQNMLEPEQEYLIEAYN